MKKKVLKLVAMLLMAAVPLLSHAEGGTISYTATYDFSQLTIGTDTLGGVTYTTVSLPGLFNGGAPGMPFLPTDYIRFSVPYNARNFTVSASTGTTKRLSLSHMLYPSQPRTQSVPCIVAPDAAVYSNAYPSATVSVVDCGMMAGENQMVTISVIPFSYSHKTYGNLSADVLDFKTTVNITLSYDLSDTPADGFLIRNDTALRAEGFRLTKRIVVNPGDVVPNSANASSIPGMLLYPGVNVDSVSNTDPEEFDGERIPYLIVTTPELSRSMRRMAALKRQKGINVKVVTIDEAINDSVARYGDLILENGQYIVSNTEEGGKLRQYLKNYFAFHATKYVLLAGTNVPARSYNLEGYVNDDIYYSDLSYDGLFRLDYRPELYVGRLSCDVKSQVDNYTDKLFRYELNPGGGDYSYLRRALITEGRDYNSFYVSMDGITETVCPDTTVIRESDTCDYPTGCDVLDSISASQYGFMAMFNEAQPSHINVRKPEGELPGHYIWAIDTVRNDAQIIDPETGNGLNMMSNKNYPVICFSGIGFTMPRFTTDGLSVGQSFTLGKDYGGPVFMGFSGDYDFYLNNINCLFFASEFSRQVTSGISELGIAHAIAKYLSPIDPEDKFTNHDYLGDPSLDMWTDIPCQYANVALTRNDNSITVNGAVPGHTTVAYCSNDGTVGSCVATASTVTLNGVSPNSTVMLYSHNYLPHIAPLLLQNTTIDRSQYVIASDVEAGKSVDINRTSGAVIVENGVDYEIEYSGTVKLQAGFNVKSGARFSVQRSDY